MSQTPNFVFVVADQMRADALGHLGSRTGATPHLDSFQARDAISLAAAFTQNPVCTPSRCALMTGWYPHVQGHRTMRNLLKPHEPCLLRKLKENGWWVWWGGKNDLVQPPHDADACSIRYIPEGRHANLHTDQRWRRTAADGQEDYSFFAGQLELATDETEYGDEDTMLVQSAIRALNERPNDQPFCLYLALQYPHPPYGSPPPYFGRTDRSALSPRIRSADCPPGKAPILDRIRERQGLDDWPESSWTELRGVYHDMCLRVDAQFGQLVAALKMAGVYETTTIVFLSDHGDYTGDYGLVEKTQNTFEDCLVRVPFLIKPPLHIPVRPGLRHGLAELIDLPATVYELAGLTFDYSQFGRSLAPLFTADGPHRSAVFCEGGREPEEIHCSEEGPGAQPGALYWPRISVQVENPAAHGKAVMCRTERYKYILRSGSTDELYDLTADPRETTNLVRREDYATIRLELRERILDFFLRTGDAVPWSQDERS